MHLKEIISKIKNISSKAADFRAFTECPLVFRTLSHIHNIDSLGIFITRFKTNHVFLILCCTDM